MIERQTIGGREATIAYLTADWQPAESDGASTYVKILFDDGEMLILQNPPRLIEGSTLAQWAASIITTDLTRIDSAIRGGLLAGLDNTEIAAKVIGTTALDGIDGATDITRRQIARLGLAEIKSAGG